MKRFCASLKEHAMKILNLEKMKMIPLKNKKRLSYANQEICHICKRSLKIKTLMIKNTAKLAIIVIIQVNIKVLHIVYVN